MMNLSMSHPVPTFGDSFTITCYVCGMPSSKEWAQKARSRPTTPMKPYFPFLLQLTPLGGSVLREDGSTYLCAFCHASLEAQWNLYESQQVVPPPNRKYNIQKFICAVCAVETYRKRIRALPFQEFPFLEKQRQPGSITLGNNPLAIVCLDCSETLWAQSAEYDRWGLPVHKRHFNWMARPPPPEDSVEATVARLPSGETQLPRCPPIEPSMGPKSQETVQAKTVEVPATVKVRGKGKGDSPKLDSSSSPIPQSSRKTSLTSTTPPTLDMLSAYHNQQPPVVTVAPMSATHTTILNVRKDSLTLPPVLIATHQPTGPPGIYPPPASAVYPPAASYAPYVWGATATRESTQRTIEAYPYRSAEGIHGAPAAGWSWLAHPSPELLRYPSYVSNLQGRTISESSTSSRSPTHPAVSSPSVPQYRLGSGSPIRYQTAAAGTDPTATVTSRDREKTAEQRGFDSSGLPSRSVIGHRSSSDESIYPRAKVSPDQRVGKKPPKGSSPDVTLQKTHVSLSQVEKPDQDSARGIRNSPQRTSDRSSPVQAQSSGPVTPDAITEQEKVYHIPKKRNWQVFMKESQGTEDDKTQKVEDNIPHPKKKKPSFSSAHPPDIARITSMEASAGLSKETNDSTHKQPKGGVVRSATYSAMDLTVSAGAPQPSSKSTGAKFRIEYLCQSESSKEEDANKQVVGDDSTKRSSVIKCAPKVPLATPEETATEAMDTVNDNNESKSNASQSSKVTLVSSGSDADDVQKKIRKVSTTDKVHEPAPEKVKSTRTNDDDDGQTISKDESGDDKNEKGNNDKSERKEQASTLNTDDDNVERNNEDLPNIEQFLKETVTELLKREKEQQKEKRESMDKQKHFLHGLGLVTPDEKTELEIKSVVSRHERKTLPPIQLRPDCKIKRRIDKQLKDLLLKVSLEDPTLFQDKPEDDKCGFMAELGMKTAEKSDKTKRDIKWRVVLMERMRRELRDAATRGVKHEWEKSGILKKFAECDLESFFNSLSYAALTTPDADLNKETIAAGAENTEEKSAGLEEDTSATNVASGGVCINYPKYIPSYAVKPGEGQDEEESAKSVVVAVGDSVEASSSGSNLPFAEPILKIPVLPTKKRLHSESSSATTVTSDTDDYELSSTTNTSTAVVDKPSAAEFIQNSNNNTAGVESSMDKPAKLFSLISSSSPSPYPVRLDKLIQCSTNYWEQMKFNIDEILEELESTKEDIPQDDKASHVKKLVNHLRSQLLDIKEIEKRLRITGKNVLNVSRKRAAKKE